MTYQLCNILAIMTHAALLLLFLLCNDRLLVRAECLLLLVFLEHRWQCTVASDEVGVARLQQPLIQVGATRPATSFLARCNPPPKRRKNGTRKCGYAYTILFLSNWRCRRVRDAGGRRVSVGCVLGSGGAARWCEPSPSRRAVSPSSAKSKHISYNILAIASSWMQ